MMGPVTIRPAGRPAPAGPPISLPGTLRRTRLNSGGMTKVNFHTARYILASRWARGEPGNAWVNRITGGILRREKLFGRHLDVNWPAAHPVNQQILRSFSCQFRSRLEVSYGE